MNKLRSIVLVLGITLGIGLIVPLNAHAVTNVISDQCAGVTDSVVCNKAQSTSSTPASLISKIVNTLLFIVGALSVIMIIIGGIIYATSAGDSGRVTTAKNTIIYAVIGLVVALLAFAIVKFVVSRFTP